MSVLGAIHALFQARPELQSAVPGGLHQDFAMGDEPPVPYGIIEDVGGTRFETSLNGVGPEDQQIRLWIFDNDSDRGMRAAKTIVGVLDNSDLVLTLDDGREAFLSRDSSLKFVTEPELMKDVQAAYQISTDLTAQLT